MPAITYEIGGKNTKLRQSLQDSKQAVRDFRQNLKAQTAGMHADAQGAGKGKGIFGAVLGGNLAANALMRMAGGAKVAVDKMGELQDISEQFGVSAGTLDKLQKSMMGSGVTASNLQKSLLNLNEARTKALNGDTKTQDLFADLAISADALEKMGLDELFFKVADGLSQIEDAGKAGSKALDLIGMRNGRLVDTMRKGGQSIKDDMAKQFGAASSETIAAVDSAKDKLDNTLSNAGGWLAGKAVKFFDDAKDFGEEVNLLFGGSGRAASEQSIGPTVAATKKSAEQKRAIFEKERDEAKKAIADKAAADEAEIESKKELAKNIDRIADSEKDRADIVRDSYTFTEKMDRARMDVLKAQSEYDKAQVGDDNTNKGREAQAANLAEAKNKFLQMKQLAIERAALPQAEQDKLREQDKAAARARKQSERTINAKNRDEIDRRFRRGEITEAQKRSEISALEAWKDQKPPDVLNDQYQKLVSIDGVLKKLTEKVEKI